MTIRPATDTDLSRILEILDEARAIMRENGNLTQWSNGYPSAEVILADIAAGEGFMCMEGEQSVGYFCFMVGKDPDPNYCRIEGDWLNDDPYGVIHRLASARLVRGVAGAAFSFAFSRIHNVRVDTHRENVPMQRFLEKEGFRYCGTIYVADGTPRDAFQKSV